MKKIKLMLSSVMALSIISLASCNKKVPSNIAILYTNDVHCAFESSDICIGIEGIAGIKELLINEYGEGYVTLVDSGDFIQGEIIGSISNGAYPREIQEYLGYEVGTFGVHEFDYGIDTLLGIGGLVYNGEMNYVSSNFILNNLNEQVVNPYYVHDYGNFKVAFIGINTPATINSSNSSNFKDEYGDLVYGFCSGNNGQDLYNQVQEHVTNALASGVDYVVALSHLGLEDEELKGYMASDVIANTMGIDIVLDGYSHMTIKKDIIKNKNGEDVILTSTGSNLQNIGKLVINTNGTKTKKDDVLDVDLLNVSEVKTLTNGLSSVNVAKQYYEEIKNRYETTGTK